MTLNIKRHDLYPPIEATLTDADGVAVDLTNASVSMHMKRVGSSITVTKSMEIVEATEGTIKYDWVNGDTDIAGVYEVEFEITFANSKPLTIPIDGYEQFNIVEDLA